MIDDKRLTQIKNLAAQRAAVAYMKTLEDECDKAGIREPGELIEALDRTQHVHDAVVFIGQAPPLLVRSGWIFSANEEAIKRSLSRSKAEGES